MTVARTGPTSAISAKKSKNASAVQTTASVPIAKSTRGEGMADGSCRSASGAYATAVTTSEAATTPIAGR